MNRYPSSIWRPVAYTGLHARQPRRAMLLHTNGGGAQLFGWWSGIAKQGKHIGAQYQVFVDGKVECYVNPDLVVYHAFGASEWAFGVETEDDGHPEAPWTPAQIRSLAGIGRFHGIPAVMLGGTAPGDGVGYHQQHPEWNQSGHNCPGHVRVAQIPQVLAAMKPAPAPAPVPHKRPHARPTPVPPAYRWTHLPLKEGDHNPDVKHAQTRLHALGFYAGLIDSDFGPKTYAATKSFQQHHKDLHGHQLVDDGEIGPLTAGALR